MSPGGQTHRRLIPVTQAVGISVGQMTTNNTEFSGCDDHSNCIIVKSALIGNNDSNTSMFLE